MTLTQNASVLAGLYMRSIPPNYISHVSYGLHFQIDAYPEPDPNPDPKEKEEDKYPYTFSLSVFDSKVSGTLQKDCNGDQRQCNSTSNITLTADQVRVEYKNSEFLQTSHRFNCTKKGATIYIEDSVFDNDPAKDFVFGHVKIYVPQSKKSRINVTGSR